MRITSKQTRNNPPRSSDYLKNDLFVLCDIFFFVKTLNIQLTTPPHTKTELQPHDTSRKTPLIELTSPITCWWSRWWAWVRRGTAGTSSKPCWTCGRDGSARSRPPSRGFVIGVPVCSPPPAAFYSHVTAQSQLTTARAHDAVASVGNHRILSFVPEWNSIESLDLFKQKCNYYF